MAVATQNPTSDENVTGTWTGSAGTRYTLVDDHPDTTGVDRVDCTAIGVLTFGFTAFSIPTGSTISSVSVDYYDFKNGSAGSAGGARLKVNGTYYNATTHNPTNATWVSRSDSWATNPNTGAAWTVADVNGTGSNPLQAFGFNVTDTTPNIRFSSVQITVTYTVTVSGTAASSSASGATMVATVSAPPVLASMASSSASSASASAVIAHPASMASSSESSAAASATITPGSGSVYGVLASSSASAATASAVVTRVASLASSSASSATAGGVVTRLASLASSAAASVSAAALVARSAVLASASASAAAMSATVTRLAALASSSAAAASMSAAVSGSAPTVYGVLASASAAAAAAQATVTRFASMACSSVAGALASGLVDEGPYTGSTLPQWHNAIRTLIYNDIAVAQGVTLAFDNLNVSQPDDELWLALEILDGPVRTVEVGPTLRRRVSGRFRLGIYAPLNTGTRASMRMVDDLATACRTASGSAVRYGVPTARTVGRSGRHWLVIADVPFTSDEIA